MTPHIKFTTFESNQVKLYDCFSCLYKCWRKKKDALKLKCAIGKAVINGKCRSYKNEM